MNKVTVEITVHLLLILFGVIPCLLLAPIWFLYMFIGLYMKENEWIILFILFLLALSWFFGLRFFLMAINDYENKKPWGKNNYFAGGYGIVGALVAIYFVISQQEQTIIPYIFLCLIFAFVVAYFTRHKKP